MMTSIIDLTDFDFETVLSNLLLKDLINLSDTNKYLRTIVRSNIPLNFSKTITLIGSKTVDIGYNISFHFTSLNIVLKFLRIFGDQIKILFFNYVNVLEKTKYVGSYVNIYCHNLNILVLRSLTLATHSFLIHQFNIKYLFFEYCHIDMELWKISLK